MDVVGLQSDAHDTVPDGSAQFGQVSGREEQTVTMLADTDTVVSDGDVDNTMQVATHHDTSNSKLVKGGHDDVAVAPVQSDATFVSVWNPDVRLSSALGY